MLRRGSPLRFLDVSDDSLISNEKAVLSRRLSDFLREILSVWRNPQRTSGKDALKEKVLIAFVETDSHVSDFDSYLSRVLPTACAKELIVIVLRNQDWLSGEFQQKIIDGISGQSETVYRASIGEALVFFGKRSAFSSSRLGSRNPVVELSLGEAVIQLEIWAARRDGRKWRNLPRLFIPGFPKCGTTALHEMLVQHSQISGAVEDDGTSCKEVRFFTRRYAEGLDWYSNQFKDRRSINLDATPIYLSNRHILNRIRKHIHNARFIIVMRDPVIRSYSHWNFWNLLPPDEQARFRLPFPEGTFEDNLRGDIDTLKKDCFPGLFSCGLYFEQIKMLRSLYSDDAIHYCFTEDLKSNPDKELNRIQDFLEIRQERIKTSSANSVSYIVPPLKKETEQWLTEAYADTVKKLRSELNLNPPWSRWK